MPALAEIVGVEGAAVQVRIAGLSDAWGKTYGYHSKRQFKLQGARAMKVQYFDRQNDADVRNGTTVTTGMELGKLLNQLDKSTPYFCEFIGENGMNLLLGMSEELSCAQYSRNDGAPPYLMAVRPAHLGSVANAEFMIGGTPTPVAGRFCIPLELGIQIATEFSDTGGRSRIVDWQEI